MKCPYNVTEMKIEYPAEFEEVGGESIDDFEEAADREVYVSMNPGINYIITRAFTECLMSECAAWQDGKCSRRA